MQHLSHPPQLCIEILDSSENGAIGFRRLDSDEEEFSLFPGVKVIQNSSGTYLQSDFVPQAESIQLDDRIEMKDTDKIIHLGRRDRVFKYAGKRWSLLQLEETLCHIPSIQKCICCFEADDRIAQGGMIVAWIEQSQPRLSTSQIKQEYRSMTLMPCPDEIYSFVEFPVDERGKTSLQLLQKFRRLKKGEV